MELSSSTLTFSPLIHFILIWRKGSDQKERKKERKKKEKRKENKVFWSSSPMPLHRTLFLMLQNSKLQIYLKLSDQNRKERRKKREKVWKPDFLSKQILFIKGTSTNFDCRSYSMLYYTYWLQEDGLKHKAWSFFTEFHSKKYLYYNGYLFSSIAVYFSLSPLCSSSLEVPFYRQRTQLRVCSGWVGLILARGVWSNDSVCFIMI